MNSFRPARRRHRVVLRPKERARRHRLAAAFAAVALLGAVAFASARHALDALTRAGRAIAASARGPEAAVVEAPEPFRTAAQASADALESSAAAKAERIKSAFPCVAEVSVRRAWGESRATIHVTLRRAIAPAGRAGKDERWLGADGELFPAPAGVYSLVGPAVEPGTAPAEALAALAREWSALSSPGAFPSRLSAMGWKTDPPGWEARLEDGTTVLWGRLDWTREKLLRLGEALSDARAKGGETFAADLRYFEDGKVLLKPARGGLR